MTTTNVVTIGKGTFNIVLMSIVIVITGMLYAGDRYGSRNVVVMSTKLKRCLEKSRGPRATADRVRTSLRRASDEGKILSVEDRLVMTSSILNDMDKDDAVYMLGSLTIDANARSSYVYAVNCRNAPFGNDDVCSGEDQHIVGEVRDHAIFGDKYARRYRFNARDRSLTRSSVSSSYADDPRASPWFENAVEGPKEGVWTQYVDPTTESMMVTFSKTFRSRGNSVVPGPSGGGAVFVSVLPPNLDECAESRCMPGDC